jgi:osmoprotectant transport system ATP-binding protein
MSVAIELIEASKRFSNTSKGGLEPTSLLIEEGSFVTILGSSGSGKTTLLKLINRLHELTSGRILIHGYDNKQIPATKLRRKIGYVIQQTGLFQHMTIAQNIAVVPEILGWKKEIIRHRIDELLTLVELDPAEFRNRYPSQLSGGQQQRVGLARALAGDPSIMLMDEPFGAIDALTRSNLQTELLRIQRKLGKTIVFVTHDVQEALKLGDKIIVMCDGKVQQYGTPFELLSRPENEFVRSLLEVNETGLPNPLKNSSPKIAYLSEVQMLRDALALMIDGPFDAIAVEDQKQRLLGTIALTANPIGRKKKIADSTLTRPGKH